MQITTGIKGIRKFIADDRRGWHVWIDDSYHGYYSQTVSKIFEILDSKNVAVYTFTGFYGNGLQFTTVGE